MSRATEIILLFALILASSLVFSEDPILDQQTNNSGLSIESIITDGISMDRTETIISLSHETLQGTNKFLLMLADGLDLFFVSVIHSLNVVSSIFRQVWCYL